MKSKQGFTLAEVIVVSLILVVLLGLFLPAYSSAKGSAKIEQSLGNLHQMSVALIMYRTEWDGDAKYGDIAEMGLPGANYVLFNRFGTPIDLWKSPCGEHPSNPPTVIQYDYFPGDGGPRYASEAGLYKENMIMFFDMNCTPADVPLYNPYQRRRGLGVLLSGALVNKFQTGDFGDPLWWGDPQP